jgi:predicted RNA-binding protein with PIN domain
VNDFFVGYMALCDKLNLHIGRLMNYIIDGHNLIAQLAGLDLSMLDDEQRLIELLVRFSGYNHHKLEVYFDRAAIGQAGKQNYGRVQAYYVPQNQTADDAIRKRLMSLRKSGKSWAVVSSDRAIQAAAREAHAGVMSSTDFANLLQARLAGTSPKPRDPTPSDDESLSEAEVKEWEAIFRQGRKPK